MGWGGACAHRRRSLCTHTDLGRGAEHGGCTSALLRGEHRRAGGLRCCRLMSFDTPCLLPQRPPPFSLSPLLSSPSPLYLFFLSCRHTTGFHPLSPSQLQLSHDVMRERSPMATASPLHHPLLLPYSNPRATSGWIVDWCIKVAAEHTPRPLHPVPPSRSPKAIMKIRTSGVSGFA